MIPAPAIMPSAPPPQHAPVASWAACNLLTFHEEENMKPLFMELPACYTTITQK